MVAWAEKDAKRVAAELGRPSKKGRLGSAPGDKDGGTRRMSELRLKRKATKARRTETRRREQQARELRRELRAERDGG